MIISTEFFAQVLKKHQSKDVVVHLCNTNARIIASTDQASIGSRSTVANFVLQEARTVVIGDEDDQNIVTYASSIEIGEFSPVAVVAVGESQKAQELGNLVKTAIETALSYQNFLSIDTLSHDERTLVGQALVENNFSEQSITAKMNKLELVPNHLRSVIYINLVHDEPTYFNVNLNLGYQSSVERKNEEIVKRLRTGKYFNTQDLIFLYDRNTVIIIKSFIETSNISRAYLSLDKICANCSTILNGFTSLKHHISYGNLYLGLREVRRSFLEANDTIIIGKRTLPNECFYRLEDLLFEHVCKNINPQIVNKIIQSNITHLGEGESEFPTELIQTAEAYVDNCMHLSRTSEAIFLHRNTISKQLSKLKDKTGLDPNNSFRDAFLVKIIAAYLKLNSTEKKTTEQIL